MGFLLVTAVLVVMFGRLGDVKSRVRIYNLGFLVSHSRRLCCPLCPDRNSWSAVVDRVSRRASSMGCDVDG